MRFFPFAFTSQRHLPTKHPMFCTVVILASLLLWITALSPPTVIKSPSLSNWGFWSKVESCPSVSFVHGMRIKYDAAISHDNTALNAIQFVCKHHNQHFDNITHIIGADGPFGVWQISFHYCSDGDYVIGFALQSDTSSSGDGTGANNFAAYCGKPDGSRNNLKLIKGSKFNLNRSNCILNFEF